MVWRSCTAATVPAVRAHSSEQCTDACRVQKLGEIWRAEHCDSRSSSCRAAGSFLRAACSMVRRSCTDATVPAVRAHSSALCVTASKKSAKGTKEACKTQQVNRRLPEAWSGAAATTPWCLWALVLRQETITECSLAGPCSEIYSKDTTQLDRSQPAQDAIRQQSLGSACCLPGLPQAGFS